jgi:hypothetical protein
LSAYICRSILLPSIVRSALVMKDLLTALVSLVALCDPIKKILVQLLHRHGPMVSVTTTLSGSRARSSGPDHVSSVRRPIHLSYVRRVPTLHQPVFEVHLTSGARELAIAVLLDLRLIFVVLLLCLIEELVNLVVQDEVHGRQDRLQGVVEDPLVQGLLREGGHRMGDQRTQGLLHGDLYTCQGHAQILAIEHHRLLE